ESSLRTGCWASSEVSAYSSTNLRPRGPASRSSATRDAEGELSIYSALYFFGLILAASSPQSNQGGCQDESSPFGADYHRPRHTRYTSFYTLCILGASNLANRAGAF